MFSWSYLHIFSVLHAYEIATCFSCNVHFLLLLYCSIAATDDDDDDVFVVTVAARFKVSLYVVDCSPHIIYIVQKCLHFSPCETHSYTYFVYEQRKWAFLISFCYTYRGVLTLWTCRRAPSNTSFRLHCMWKICAFGSLTAGYYLHRMVFAGFFDAQWGSGTATNTETFIDQLEWKAYTNTI